MNTLLVTNNILQLTNGFTRNYAHEINVNVDQLIDIDEEILLCDAELIECSYDYKYSKNLLEKILIKYDSIDINKELSELHIVSMILKNQLRCIKEIDNFNKENIRQNNIHNFIHNRITGYIENKNNDNAAIPVTCTGILREDIHYYAVYIKEIHNTNTHIFWLTEHNFDIINNTYSLIFNDDL